MFKENKKRIVITSLIILVPILVGLILWGKLPDQIATHFDSSGEANGWSSKLFAVVGLPFFILACHLLSAVTISSDPRKSRINDKLYKLILLICPSVSVICAAAIYTSALGIRWNFIAVMQAFIGILFIVVGNYLPKCRQNYTVGIKLPWTLADEENWNKTHRLGGWLFIAAGIAELINAFVRNELLMIIPLAAAVAIPALYSFILYKKKENS